MNNQQEDIIISGCPEGMYPMDSTYPPNEYDTFAELRRDAEDASDVLNLPISWFFDDEEHIFQLVFLMPRKNKTWSKTTTSFNRGEVQEWLDTWLRGEINKWFGWDNEC